MAFAVPVAFEPFRDVVAGAEAARGRRRRRVGGADAGPADEQQRPAPARPRPPHPRNSGLPPIPGQTCQDTSDVSRPSGARSGKPTNCHSGKVRTSTRMASPRRLQHLPGFLAERRPRHKSSALLLLPTPRPATGRPDPWGGRVRPLPTAAPVRPDPAGRPTWWDGKKATRLRPRRKRAKQRTPPPDSLRR